MHARTLDIVVIVGYLIFMLLIGFFTSKKSGSSAEEYTVASRSLSMKFYFPCMCALVLGGSSTLGSARYGYELGISGIFFLIMLGFGTLILGAIFAKPLSKLNITTVGELLDIRFGKVPKYMSSLFLFIYLVVLSSVQIIACGSLLNTLFGWDLALSMLIGGAVGIIYSTMGGMLAVTYTDCAQWIFMTIGVFFILFPTSLSQVGGVSNLINSVPKEYLSLGNAGFARILSWFILYLLGMFLDQSMWQRMFTAKSLKVAKNGTIGAGIYTMLYGLVVVVIGMCGAVLLPGLADPQQTFATMALTYLPAGIAGIIFAGVLSAVMSTMDGPLLSAATIVLNDIILPVKPNMPEKKKVAIARIALGASGVVAMVIALWLQDVLVALDFAYAVIVGGLLCPVVTALFWKRVTSKAATISVICSMLTLIISMINFGVSANEPIIYAFVVGLVVLIVATFATKPEYEKYDYLYSEERIGKSAVWED